MQRTDLFSDLNNLFGIRNSNEELESRLKKWAEPPGATEQAKSDHAVAMVKKAIDADQKLKTMNITAFAKGSYYNRTNIPSESDVDVAVRLNNLFYNDYPEGTTCHDFGFSPATYSFEDFRKDVVSAIVSYFGADKTTVGSKAIQVHSNTVRVDADVVPHVVHRRYNLDKTYIEGVALKTPSGQLIHNWPVQDYENGVQKNNDTSRGYKGAVRILKNLKCEMLAKGYKSAETAGSFLIASLVWNTPNHVFEDESYVKIIDDCLAYLKERTSDLANVNNWKEVNGIKDLFGTHQAWKFDEVHSFICDMAAYFQELKK